MRGLYNQNEGNEIRSAAVQTSEHYSDNDLCEGEVRAKFAGMFAASVSYAQQGLVARSKEIGEQIETFIAELKTAGYSFARIQSMMHSATLAYNV